MSLRSALRRVLEEESWVEASFTPQTLPWGGGWERRVMLQFRRLRRAPDLRHHLEARTPHASLSHASAGTAPSHGTVGLDVTGSAEDKTGKTWGQLCRAKHSAGRQAVSA